MTGFDDAKYTEIYISIKGPIPEGMTYKEMEERTLRTSMEAQTMLEERFEVLGGDWVYRDVHGDVVDEPLE